MNNSKNALKGLIGIGSYILSLVIFFVPLLFIKTNSLTFKIIYSLFQDIVQLLILVLIFKNELKDNLKDLKKNYKTYFKKYFKYWFLIIGIMMVSNYIILTFFNGTTASNQQAINNSFDKAPIYTFISAVFFAPILEELVFRLSIRKIFKNKYLFIFISGFVFGGLHVFISMTSPLELLYLIPYCTPGFIFAYLLYKTDNIFVPTFIHFFHNGLLLSIQLIAMVLS